MAAIPPLSHPKYPLPIDVRLKLPDPTTPWKIGDRIMGEMSAQASSPYQKVEVLQDDPEWNFVWEMFHHDKPIRWDMIGAYCIREPHQTRSFELNLVTQDREADKFTPTWHSEPRAEQRARVIDRWRKTTAPFSPFQTMESGGRSEPLTKVQVLPLWHGSSHKVCASIAETGFAFFGKKSIGKKAAGDPKSTDVGFFGSGIYFANSARYAADIYSTGHLVLAWVSMREPFPVVGDANQSDMQTLQGGGAYKHYNAHYIPVCPQKMSHLCAMYFPCKEGESPFCDEVVVFQKAQTLPRFWVVLEPSALHLMQPNFSSKGIGKGDNKQLDTPLRELRKNYQVRDKFGVLVGDKVCKIAWDTDGKKIVTYTLERHMISYRDADSGEITEEFSPERKTFRKCWNSTRTRILTAVYDPLERPFAFMEKLFRKRPFNDNVAVFNLAGTERFLTLKGHTDEICEISWSSNEKKAASSSEDKTIRIWDLTHGNLIHTLKGHKGDVNLIQWSPDDRLILSAGGTIRVAGGLIDEEVARMWNAESGELIHTLKHYGQIEGLSWSPDSSQFLSSGGFNRVLVWDAKSGIRVRALHVDRGGRNLVWSPNGKYILCGNGNGFLYIWGAKEGKLLKKINAMEVGVTSLALSPDQKEVVTGGYLGSIRVWKMPDVE